MEHDELKEGTYCAPANVKEREAILALAESLGLGGWAPDRDGGDYIFVGRLISNGEIRAVDRSVAAFKEQPRSTWKRTNCLYFIAAMYRLAEKRKTSPKTQVADARRTKDGQIQLLWEHLSRMESTLITEKTGVLARVDALERRKFLLDGALEHGKHLDTVNEETDKRISNLETALNEHMVGTKEALSQRYLPEKLHGLLIALERVACDHLMQSRSAGAGDQVTNDEQAPYSYQIICGPGWVGPDINRKASPKNIPFEVALAYLKAGRKVRRTSWLETLRVEPRNGGIGGLEMISQASLNRGSFEPKQPDMMATDWEVVPEP